MCTESASLASKSKASLDKLFNKNSRATFIHLIVDLVDECIECCRLFMRQLQGEDVLLPGTEDAAAHSLAVGSDQRKQ